MLLGQLAGIGTNGIALLDGCQEKLTGNRTLALTRLAGEHRHSAFSKSTDELIQRRNHRLDTRNGCGIIGDDVRLLDDTLNRDGLGTIQRVKQNFRAVKEENFVGIFAGRAVRTVGILLDNAASCFVQPA